MNFKHPFISSYLMELYPNFGQLCFYPAMRVTLYIVGSKSFTNILKISKLLLFVFWLNEENDQNQSEPIVERGAVIL